MTYTYDLTIGGVRFHAEISKESPNYESECRDYILLKVLATTINYRKNGSHSWLRNDSNAYDFAMEVNLVQNVGSLAELFTGGQLVLNKEVVLSDGSVPLELTVLSARKQFVQNLDYDSDEKPQVFNTLDEVKAVGGTIEWEGNVKPSFTPVLHVNIVFKAPAGLDYALPLEHNGSAYGLAVWTLRGVAYTRAGKNILTAAKFSLRDGLFHGKWELTSKREKFGRNSVFVPVLRNVGRNTPDFVNYLRTIG